MGGRSSERDISIQTGNAVLKVLRDIGIEAYPLDLDENLCERLKRIKPDKAFIALHGAFGEDGKIQGLLEILGIDYVGSSLKSHAISFDKDIAKQIFKFNDINTPYWKAFKKNQKIQWEHYPAIVKPSSHGSSVGLFLVKDEKELCFAIEKNLEIDDKVIVEEYIEGTDMTVGFLKGKLLPPIEIRTKKGIYDFESKYTKGFSEYIFVEDLDLIKKLYTITEKIIDIFELKDMARVDFRVNRKGDIFALEINTIPGMTELSLLPMAASKIGIDFKSMVKELLGL